MSLALENLLEPVLGDHREVLFTYNGSSASGAWAGYFVTDALGSVREMRYYANYHWGELRAEFRYDSFGQLLYNYTAPSYDTIPYRFTSREWESESGLYFFRSRYYDPRVGRFTGEDPIAFEADTNFYRYTWNNPTTFSDPFGTAPPRPEGTKPPNTIPAGSNNCYEGDKLLFWLDADFNPMDAEKWKKFKRDFIEKCDAASQKTGGGRRRITYAICDTRATASTNRQPGQSPMAGWCVCCSRCMKE